MAEYKLSYTASEIDERLAKVDKIPTKVSELENDEKYINAEEFEGRITVATFNVTTENTTITLKNLTGMTKIDWGDGVVNSEYYHNYAVGGSYECKVYNVTYIGIYAFQNCNSLTSVVIGDSVTSIGDSAFSGCSNLTSVEIGDSVITIYDYAFSGCRSLTSVVIGDSVTSIGDLAFSGCSNLTSVVIPDNVASIRRAAFFNCSNLTSVVIGDRANISDSAFSGCDNLQTVIFKSSTPIAYLSTMFPNTVKLFLVPHDSLEAYKTAWTDVADKIDSIAYVGDINNTSGSSIDMTAVTTNQIPAYISEKFQNSGLKSYEHLESEKAFRVRTNPDTNANQSITITDEAIYNSKNDGDVNGTFNLAHSALHVENSAYKTDYAPWGINFNGSTINFPNISSGTNTSFATNDKIDAQLTATNERITIINDELASAINSNHSEMKENLLMVPKFGWKVDGAYLNYEFELKNEDGSIAYQGFSNVVRYVNVNDSNKHMIEVDVYVTSPETMAPEALTIPSGIMGTTTIGYKWENGYFPVSLACPNEMIGDDWLNFTRRDVESYSWIRGTNNLVPDIGWMDGSGSISPHMATQLTKGDDGATVTGIYSYVQGQAVALSSSVNAAMTITGQHFVVKMYDFFN